MLPDSDRVLERWAREFGCSPSNVTGLLAGIGTDVAGAAQYVARGVILKPAIADLPDFDVNEHLCLAAARNHGLRAATTSIQTFDEQRVLVERRYDRIVWDDGTILRVHQEDLCQALSVRPNKKHESVGGPGAADSAASSTRSPARFCALRPRIVPVVDHRAARTSLRITTDGRIMVTPTASAVGSGPGCQPFGWGAGFCALGPQFDHIIDDEIDERCPPVACPVGPRDGICDPEDRFVQRAPMAERERRLGVPAPCDGPMVVPIVLTTLDRQPRHGSILELSNDLDEARIASLELTHTVTASTGDHGDAYRQSHDQLEGSSPRTVELLVEVQPLPGADERSRRTSDERKVPRLDEYARHEVPRPADRLVDERVGERHALHPSSPFKMSLRPAATARSAAAKASP